MLFVYLLVYAIVGVIWGVATQSVIENRGYDENWFWWGFFFGLIALIVALSKPQQVSSGAHGYETVNKLSQMAESAEAERTRNQLLKNGGWKCACGKVNPSYTGTCSCGKTRKEAVEQEKEKERRQLEEKQKQEELQKLQAENANLDHLKKLKELLDMGAISQDEYDAKKKQILGL